MLLILRYVVMGAGLLCLLGAFALNQQLRKWVRAGAEAEKDKDAPMVSVTRFPQFKLLIALTLVGIALSVLSAAFRFTDLGAPKASSSPPSIGQSGDGEAEAD